MQQIITVSKILQILKANMSCITNKDDSFGLKMTVQYFKLTKWE